IISLYLLLLILPFFSSNLSAQNSASTAYVITLNGDTLHGSFDLSTLSESPEKVGFKTDLESSYTFYDPTQIKGFSLNAQERYVSRKVDINTTPIAIEKIGIDTKDPVFRSDTVFLRMLVGGRANFYGLLEKGRWHYFIEKQETPLEELILTRYISYREGEKVSAYDERYKRRLRNLFSDSEEIFALVPLIDNAKYQEADLVHLFFKYNESFDSLAFYLKDVRKVNSYLGIIGGITSQKINVEGFILDVPIDFNRFSYTYSLGYEMGFFAKHVNSKSGVLFKQELIFSFLRATGSWEGTETSGLRQEEKLEVNFLHLDFNNLIIKKLGKLDQTNFPFIEAGVSANFLLNKNTSWNQKIISSSSETEVSGDINRSLGLITAGLLIGVGYDISPFNFGFRYELRNSFLKRTRSGEPSSAQRLAIIFGHKL
ncbi:MAG: outer membrane beta-barrel protein, partial [Bacteroidota bacterium]